jgi:hypothetical protein
MSDTPKHYALTFLALQKAYRRVDPDSLAALAAEVCKRGLAYVDPATQEVRFHSDVKDLAPRLCPPPALAPNASEQQKLQAFADQMRRSEDKPTPRGPRPNDLPDYRADVPMAKQLRTGTSEADKAYNAALYMQRAVAPKGEES